MESPKRLLILQMLIGGEQSVGSLSEQVGLSQSALSQHLAKLRAAKLVHARRDVQMIYYSCTSLAVQRILATLETLFASAQEPKESRRASS